MSDQLALFVLPTEDHFDGNNWFEWHGTIWSAAGACGVQGYLEGTIPKPSLHKPGMTPTSTNYWGSKTPSPEEWEQPNAYAKSIIDLNVKNPIGHGIQPMHTAAEAWSTLKDIHNTPSDMGLLNANNALCAIKHVDGTNIIAHFTRMHEAWAKINAQGRKMDDLTFRTIIIASMPKEWDLIIGTLFTLKTSKEVIASLTLYDTTLAHHRKPVLQPTQALATTQTRTNCSNEVCSNPNCKHIGHTIERCFKAGGGMEGQYPDWWRRKGNATGGRNSNQTPGTTPTPSKPTENVAIVPTTTFTSSNTGSDGDFHAFLMNTSTPTPALTTYADLAASNHFFIDIRDFESYEPYTGRSGSTAKNGRSFTICGKGNVRKCCIYDGRVIMLLFKDGLHCPSLSHNLITIGKLDAGGCYAVFGGGGITFVNPEGWAFMHGKGEGTMYEVDIFPPNSSLFPHNMTTSPDTSTNISAALKAQVTALATKSHNKPIDIDMCHHCLGHVSYDMIQ